MERKLEKMARAENRNYRFKTTNGKYYLYDGKCWRLLGQTTREAINTLEGILSLFWAKNPEQCLKPVDLPTE